MVKENFEEMISKNTFYCPICKHRHQLSNYLKQFFKDDEKAMWLSNMVTHYRHNHITSWNKCWGTGGRYYRGSWFGNYYEEKRKVNERAKREIIRKCSSYMIDNKVTIDTLKKLQRNDIKTLELAQKKL